eukprot:SAG31_NODE_2524_length_5562_cov_2.904997_2_plen_1014_part_00
MAAGTPQLRPLVDQLANLTGQTMGMLLTDAYQNRHEEGHTSIAAIQLQKEGHLSVENTPQLSAACVFLVRRARRPGITVGDVNDRLSAFGFKEEHVKSLFDVIQWIDQQQPKQATVDTDSVATEKTSSATDEKMNALFALMGSDSDDDDGGGNVAAGDWRKGDWLTDEAIDSADEAHDEDEGEATKAHNRIQGVDIVSGRIGRVVAATDVQQLAVLLHGLEHHLTLRVLPEDSLDKLQKVETECECSLRDIVQHLARFLGEDVIYNPENQSQIKKALGPKKTEVFMKTINAIKPLQREIALSSPLTSVHVKNAGDWFSMKSILPGAESSATWTRKWVELEDGIFQIFDSPKHVASASNFVSKIPLNACLMKPTPEAAQQLADNPQYAFQLDIISGDEVIGEYPDKIILSPAVFEGPKESERWQSRILYQRALTRKCTEVEPAPEPAEQSNVLAKLPAAAEIEGWLSVEMDTLETDETETVEEENQGPWPRRWVSIQNGWLCIAETPEFSNAGHFTCEMPIEYSIVTAQPKRIRRDAQFAFRVDVVEAHTSDICGLEKRPKLVIDPIDPSSRTRWLSQISASITRSTGNKGWLRLEEKKNQWSKLWFNLSNGKLEIFPSEDSERQDRVALILLDTVVISATTKSKRVGAEFAFRVDVEDSSRVFGKPLTKLVLDPETEENNTVWVGLLRQVSTAADLMASMCYSFFLPSQNRREEDYCFGLKLSDDLMVTGFTDDDDDGNPSPAKEAGVCSGQRILEANGVKFADKRTLLDEIRILPKGAEIELIVQEASAVQAGGGRTANFDSVGAKKKFAGLRRKSISLAQGITGHHGPSAERVDVSSRRASIANSAQCRMFEVDAMHLGKKHKKVQMRIGGREIAFFAGHGQQLDAVDYGNVRRWGVHKDKIVLYLLGDDEKKLELKAKGSGVPDQISDALTENMMLYRQRQQTTRASMKAKAAVPDLAALDEAEAEQDETIQEVDEENYEEPEPESNHIQGEDDQAEKSEDVTEPGVEGG